MWGKEEDQTTRFLIKKGLLADSKIYISNLKEVQNSKSELWNGSL